MKTPLLLLFTLFLYSSCFDREKRVYKDNLLGDDYRLFQDTPAWELAKAVQDENAEKIIGILQKAPKLINYQEPKFGNTLLMLTIQNQQLQSFETLLSNRADVHLHDFYDGSSALIEACSFKQYDIRYAELLLEYGANVNDVEIGVRREGNTTRATPLMAASQQGRLDLIKLLIAKGADVSYQNEYGHSALSRSIMTENYGTAIHLLESGADYQTPIFSREEENREMYLVDVLREDFFELNTDEFVLKMEIVEFLRERGINYRASPIPDYIRKKAQEAYPHSWKDYLAKY